MKYISTRENFKASGAPFVIKSGMVPSGGLFVPEKIPVLSKKTLLKFAALDYRELAFEIFKIYLKGYTASEIKGFIKKAYAKTNFKPKNIVSVKKINSLNVLELYHGPTHAFKDVALQILPYFLTSAVKKERLKSKIMILTATSGDTGKAALEGFKNVKNTKIIVFYPHNGVSSTQKLQMATTRGNNTYVYALKGNFDDCQTAVKKIFEDKKIINNIKKQGYDFSSANSINWGRLLPQIVYYFYGYFQMVKNKSAAFGEKINIAVPTGNFGNILAAFYSKRMGLPVNKLICASNKNKILSDFFETGVYDLRRKFYKTSSPSMDILVSSNLERLLYHYYGSGAAVKRLINSMNKNGCFKIKKDVLIRMKKEIYADWSSEADVFKTIKNVFKNHNYLIDTHTAVGFKVTEDYYKKTKDKTPALLASTASPYKFSADVYRALTGKTVKDGFDALFKLEKLTDVRAPIDLKKLNNAEILHKSVFSLNEINQTILKALK